MKRGRVLVEIVLYEYVYLLLHSTRRPRRPGGLNSFVCTW